MSSNGFPLTSRKQVLTRISASSEYAIECVGILDSGGRWMASHKSRAAKLMARLAAGAPTAEDLAEAVALASCYARTLARLARAREIAEGSPELQMRAAVFGVVRPASLVEATPVQMTPTPTPVVDATATTEAPVATPKRRGRPPGSKNKKPRSEPEQPKRRRRRS